MAVLQVNVAMMGKMKKRVTQNKQNNVCTCCAMKIDITLTIDAITSCAAVSCVSRSAINFSVTSGGISLEPLMEWLFFCNQENACLHILWKISTKSKESFSQIFQYLKIQPKIHTISTTGTSSGL